MVVFIKKKKKKKLRETEILEGDHCVESVEQRDYGFDGEELRFLHEVVDQEILKLGNVVGY